MNEKVQNVLDKILKSFEEGNIPEALAITVLPQLDVPCSKWSLANRLIVFFSGSSDVRGFRQWKQEGRWPKKGSKAVYILTPSQRKVKDNETEEEKMITTGFYPAPVFRVEDTEGDKIEYPELQPTKLPPLYEVAEHFGLKVSYSSFQGDAYGYFSPKQNEIVLATHDEQVFFHELTHAAHKKVLGTIKLGQDWKQEIVAELSAAVLMNLYGRRSNDGKSYQYIASYSENAGHDPHTACLKVIADVGKCLELILQIRERLNSDPEQRGNHMDAGHFAASPAVGQWQPEMSWLKWYCID